MFVSRGDVGGRPSLIIKAAFHTRPWIPFPYRGTEYAWDRLTGVEFDCIKLVEPNEFRGEKVFQNACPSCPDLPCP